MQELIANYPGTVLLVSHDRDFLDRTVEQVIVSEGLGRWVTYAGGYSDMLVQKKQAPVDEAAKAEKTEKGRGQMIWVTAALEKTKNPPPN